MESKNLIICEAAGSRERCTTCSHAKPHEHSEVRGCGGFCEIVGDGKFEAAHRFMPKCIPVEMFKEEGEL